MILKRRNPFEQRGDHWYALRWKHLGPDHMQLTDVAVPRGHDKAFVALAAEHNGSCVQIVVTAHEPVLDIHNRFLGAAPSITANVAGRGVRRIGDAAAFWAAVCVLGDRLVERGRIDFVVRKVLAALSTVPHDAVTAGGQPPVTDARRHAAAWIWHELTCGDVRRVPAYRGGAKAGSDFTSDGYRRFSAWSTGSQRLPVRQWGAVLLIARHLR